MGPGAFFRYDILDWLEVAGANFAIQAPFYRWLGLQSRIRQPCRWYRVNDAVEVEPWSWTLLVTIYRKRTRHETRKHYQVDLFDPDDGYYEYSAIVTNKAINGATVWIFSVWSRWV